MSQAPPGCLFHVVGHQGALSASYAAICKEQLPPIPSRMAFLLPQPDDEVLPRNSSRDKARMKPGKLGLPLPAQEMPLLGFRTAESLLDRWGGGLMMGPQSLSSR